MTKFSHTSRHCKGHLSTSRINWWEKGGSVSCCVSLTGDLGLGHVNLMGYSCTPAPKVYHSIRISSPNVSRDLTNVPMLA